MHNLVCFEIRSRAIHKFIEVVTDFDLHAVILLDFEDFAFGFSAADEAHAAFRAAEVFGEQFDDAFIGCTLDRGRIGAHDELAGLDFFHRFFS